MVMMAMMTRMVVTNDMVLLLVIAVTAAAVVVAVAVAVARCLPSLLPSLLDLLLLSQAVESTSHSFQLRLGFR